ncbi:hypothetical protein BJX63DRAFT_7614 [Aspergillus granulosus]|uniref:Uncharacterized protein n=1 Tax=Aspergillus granulosus TaxID=176169 RepID=A0ABR4I605_9EURO
MQLKLLHPLESTLFLIYQLPTTTFILLSIRFVDTKIKAQGASICPKPPLSAERRVYSGSETRLSSGRVRPCSSQGCDCVGVGIDK